MKKVSLDLIEQYLKKSDWQINENANEEYSLQGLNNYISSALIKEYWVNKIYPTDILKAVTCGDMHIHDLSSLSSYCVGWDLEDLVMTGFRGSQTKIVSKPAKHLGTILGQLVNFFYTLQGEAAGAQAVSNFDTLLAPFIRYDNLNFKQVKQALQEFMFNMNVPTRVGFQTPFTNVTLDLFPPSTLADKPAIIGGKPQKEKYGDFQKEMNLFNRAFMETMKEGDAEGRIFTFPIPTYNITKNFDWDNPNLDGLWEMTAKYGIPYFSNFINSNMNPEDARSMCCRLRLDNRELRSRGGGLFGANPLTGSVGVVTVNMPCIGYQSTSKEEFFERLHRVMDLASKSLEIKRNVIERCTDKGMYPYAKFYLRRIKQGSGAYWTNHFSTIGLVGMNEACVNFLGRDIATPEGQEFSKEVLEFMRARIRHYQETTGIYYNLEATPAEGTAYRLAKKDKERFPEIFVANEVQYQEGTQEPFYTNSTHLPVDYTRDIFELLDLQDDLQTKYTGGTVVHVFVGEEITDTNAVKSLVKKICNMYHLPYFTITPTFSVCPTHGYEAGKKVVCDQCGRKNFVYSRIVGYYGAVRNWNLGKKAEFANRKTFSVPPSSEFIFDGSMKENRQSSTTQM